MYMTVYQWWTHVLSRVTTNVMKTVDLWDYLLLRMEGEVLLHTCIYIHVHVHRHCIHSSWLGCMSCMGACTPIKVMCVYGVWISCLCVWVPVQLPLLWNKNAIPPHHDPRSHRNPRSQYGTSILDHYFSHGRNTVPRSSIITSRS